MNATAGLLIAASFALFLAGLCRVATRLSRIAEFRAYLWLGVAFMVLALSSGVTTVLGLFTAPWLSTGLAPLSKVLCAVVVLTESCFFFLRAPSLAMKIRKHFDLIAINKVQAERLCKSEEFLDRTGRVAGVGGWEVDLVTNEITWSDETCRIHGVSPGHRPTMDEALNVYPGEARKTISDAVFAATAGGPGFDLELPVVRFDGRQIWARAVGVAEIRDGQAIRLSGAFQDVTAKVEARAALQLANERVAIATDSGGIGIWDWDIEQNILICDAWMYQLHGKDPATSPVPGELWRDHLHPEDREHVERALNDAISGAKDYDTEFRLIWDDGSVHDLRGAARVTRDVNGRALHMVGSNWDVTESRSLIRQLAEERELLRVTLNSIGDGVVTANMQGRVDWLNPVAERMTGWPLAEAIGLPLSIVFQTLNDKDLDTSEYRSGSWRSQGELEAPSRQTFLISRDGRQYGIESSDSPINGTRGELLGKVLVFRDVTEQRRLTAQADEAVQSQLRLKDEFLSHVSHELRSPLTSIYSFCSIISDGLAGETTEQQQEYLGIVLKNVAQLQSMIEDLLAVTQFKEGKLSIERRQTSLSDAIVDALQTLQSAAANKKIALVRAEETYLPEAYADPTRLRQILIILLDNAIKFTPAHGQVGVEASINDEDALVVKVWDTGCGIPVEKQSRVFENLYQVMESNADTSQTGRTGLGLGLHIARNLVLQQGGYIWVTSVPGEGSVFQFTLPIYAGQGCSSESPRRRRTDLIATDGLDAVVI